MILQKLLFPNAQSGADQEMYFRTDGRFDETGGAVCLKKGHKLSLDTYFNSFSIEKWMKYTRLTGLALNLKLKGGFRIRIFNKALVRDAVSSRPVSETICSGEQTVRLPLPCTPGLKGIYTCELEALEDGCQWAGGFYSADMDESALNPVDIAIDICTFRREAFVTRNIALLNEAIIANPESPLFGHLEIFISDNGKTLDIPSLESKSIHIFPNKNVGGSGGFARGMIEILKYGEKKAFTHVLVMDDDVLINPDAIERTFRLLQLLKPEYAGKTIAGAMMRLDHRFIQHENCAFWNGKYTDSARTSLDMKQLDNVLLNEIEGDEKVNFNAWWYSCIPVSKISFDNLPLPLFIRFDDVEYGLRTGSDILSLNGVCLWHEPFEYKYSSSMDYYHIRNSLIVNSYHRPDINGLKAAAEVLHQILCNLVRYRYGNIELIFRAVDDFLKGADHMLALDAEALHKELMAASQKFLPLDQLSVPFDQKTYDECRRLFDPPVERALRGEKVSKTPQPRPPKELFMSLVRKFTLNGLILPAKGTYIVHPVQNHTSSFFRKRAVLNYDAIGKKGFVSTRSVKRSFALLLRAAIESIRLAVCYRRVCRGYLEKRASFTSYSFWKGYLNL